MSPDVFLSFTRELQEMSNAPKHTIPSIFGIEPEIEGGCAILKEIGWQFR